MAEGIPLGPYVLVRRLARGGMAEIFLARRDGPEGFSRELVVKRILPHLAADAEFSGMFLEEARVAARLAHPNVVHVYDFGVVDGQYYLAMELVRGVDLHGLIARAAEQKRARREGGGLPYPLAAKILSFACEGLAHAHALAGDDGTPLGLVHRDFTPSNVLVSFDGAVKVADFGIVKAKGSRDPTRVGVVKGKRTYLSPEQSRGGALDLRSDLFNVGIALYEAVTGAPLFSEKEHRGAMEQVLAGKIPNERWLRDVPEPLVATIRRALSPRREDRHPSALALRTELEAFLRTTPEPVGAPEIGAYVRAQLPDVVAADRAAPRAAGTVPAITAEMESPVDDDTTDVRDARAPVPSPVSPGTAFVTVAEAQPTPPAPASSRRPPLAIVAVLLLGALAIAAVVAVGLSLGPGTPTTATQLDTPPRTTPVLPPALPPALPPTPPPSLPPSLPPPVPSAHLHVESRPPGAQLLVDDLAAGGTTPLDVELEPGEHTLEVRLDGYTTEASRLTLAEGESTRLVLPLRRERRGHVRPPPPPVATGLLTISTTPWSDVYLGRRHLGTTPLANVTLPAGTHALTLRAPGHAPRTVRVTIVAGETARVRESL